MPDIDLAGYSFYIKLVVLLMCCIFGWRLLKDRQTKAARRAYILDHLLRMEAGSSCYALTDASNGLLTSATAIVELRDMQSEKLVEYRVESVTSIAPRGSQPILLWRLTSQGVAKAKELS